MLYRAALAGYRTYGLRFTLALTIFDMAKLLGIDDPAVRSVLDEGREILEELGARNVLGAARRPRGRRARGGRVRDRRRWPRRPSTARVSASRS